MVSVNCFLLVLGLALLCRAAIGVNIAQARADLARGGRAVCPWCWACAHEWNCDRPCRPTYRHLCPLCAYRFHCQSTCINICPFPETPSPTPPPETTPAPVTTPEPTTPGPTPDPEPCSPNPCPLNGICQENPMVQGRYTCSCPEDVDPCDDEIMDVFKRYDYDRNGPSFNDVWLEHPIEGLALGTMYQYTRTELEFFSDLPGIHNGPQDAARHALTNLRWTREYGADIAKKFADAHERSSPNPFAELAMDLHNNAMGRQLAQDPANANRDAMEVIREALEDGTLQDRLNPRHPSNFDGIVEPDAGYQ